MTTRATLLALMATFAAGSAAAQGGHVNLRLAQNQPSKYTPPLCPLKAVNSKVDKAIDMLKKAYDPKADRAATLAEAQRTLLTAITQEAQGANAAAWYYLGRVYLMQGDPAGVDSSFTKAQALAPSCEIDITQYRQNSWAMLANAAIDFNKKGQPDSALTLFRDATILFRGMPHVYQNMGIVFANSGQNDSAGIYFAKALAIAEKDSTMVEDRNAAALNVALMYQRMNRHPEAIGALRKYLAWKPNDVDARKALAGSFRVAGMTDSAEKIESAMVAEFAKANLDSLDTSDLLAVGVAAFNGARYPDAAAAFSKALARNPWSRDARYNLANSYFALKDWGHLEEEAGKLTLMEPFNEDALRLLAQGQKQQQKDELVLKTAERLVAMPFGFDVTGFQMGPQGAKLTGQATGRNAMDPTGKPLKTAPVALVFEFVDVNGAVVDTKEATIPVLAKDATHAVQLEGKGAGIVGWRYHVK
jgi:tetratricopeptide (TPR) repeat protein